MSEPSGGGAKGTPETTDVRDQELAGQLLVASNAAIRVLRVHDNLNDAVSKPMVAVQKLVDNLSERHPRVILALVEGVFYLDTTRIRLTSARLPVATQLAEEFAARAIGGISFESGITLEELVTFFRTLDSLRHSSDYHLLQAALAEAGVKKAGVSKVLRPITEADAKKSAQDQAADVYVAAIKHVSQVIGTKGGGSTPRSKRIIHELVDLADNDPVTLLALAGLRDTGSEESEHSVAVTALSIALGRRIGLERNLLADLGIAALNHDVGLVEVGDDAKRDVDRHPIIALRSILRYSPTEALFRQVLSAFEHHRDYDGGGHPAVPGLGKPHLFAQILKVTNDFDSLTRGRRGREPLDVPEVASTMQRGSGTAYNPTLLTLFFDLIGGLDEEGSANVSSSPPSDVDVMLAAFLGKAIEEPSPPKPISDVDLMLAAFLGKPVDEPPPSRPKPISDVDLMLAEFLGKKEEVVQQAASAHAPAASAKAPKAPKKNALGAMKLKKVPRKKAAATA